MRLDSRAELSSNGLELAKQYNLEKQRSGV